MATNPTEGSTQGQAPAQIQAPPPGLGGGRQSVMLATTRPRYGEKLVMSLLWLCAVASVLTTVGIIFVLFVDAGAFFASPAVSVREFFTGTQWTPYGQPGSPAFHTGVLPLLVGTLMVTAIATVVAVPLGLATAIYLSEYAKPRVRGVLKPALEVLSGVPTVVLGYFALTFVTPIVLRGLLGEQTVQIFNAASAGLVMGIMIVPIIASLSEDAMSAVPHSLREGAYGLGSAKRHVVMRVVLPAALSGIVAAVILGVGRAIGETMLVAIAGGGQPNLTANPLQGIQAMTAYIVQAIGGESPRGSLTYQSLFAVGALLFLMTFTLNVLAQRFVRRFREVY